MIIWIYLNDHCHDGTWNQYSKYLYCVAFIVIPVLLIFFKEPIHRKFHHEGCSDGIGGFITEGFFELFEVILSYVTNTLSFMRVGGFVLSHAGLMLVVKVLAGADAIQLSWL